MIEAKYYTKLENEKVQCTLCPHNCILNLDEFGICNVRKNASGFLFSSNFEKISAFSFDPIEKKPLYHFFPGREILSIGSYGCNLECNFCQNSDISQAPFENFNRFNFDINDIIEAISNNKNNIGIAFTYNEPTVWIEYILEIVQKIDKSLKKVMVTNGFINKEPLNELLKHIDAFNVDLKSFSNDFYKKETKSSIETVKETIKTIKKAGKHIEITNLIIPGKNDDKQLFEEMIDWIASELGKDTPLHLSRYFPNYKSEIPETEISTLVELHKLAKKQLNYVYIGNIKTAEGQNTYCPECHTELISRTGYYTVITELENKTCRKCNSKINIRV